MGKKDKKGKPAAPSSESNLAASKSRTLSKEVLSKSKASLYDSSSESSKEEIKVKEAKPPPAEKAPKPKKGKKKVEEAPVDLGPGPGAEGIGETAMAEVIRIREEIAAAILARLEAEGGLIIEKPKKPKKPPKQKKVKMTREMIEQMKKEAEAEEARLAEMERQRIEAEVKAAVDKEKRESVEQQVRGEQLEKSRILRENVKNFNKKIDKKEWGEVDWILFIACGALPNPSIIDHMSTYLHLWQNVMQGTTMEVASKRTYDIMKLISDIEDLLDVFVDEHVRKIGNWKWMIQLFRDHQHESLDVATYKVLRCVTRNMRRINLPTADFDFVDDFVRLSLWLRVQLPIPLPNPRRAPKPRIDINFRNMDMTVYFPWSVDCENMAIRAMYLTYDHLSDLSDTFYIPTVPFHITADLNEITKLEWRFKLKYKYKFRERIPKEPNPEDPPGAPPVYEVEKEEFADDEDVPAVPYRKMDPTSSEYAIATENLLYTDTDNVFNLDLPKYVVNLRRFVILGGIYAMDLLRQPPQPQAFVTMDLEVTTLSLPKRLEYVPFYIEYIPPEPWVPPVIVRDHELEEGEEEEEYVRPPEEIEAEMKKFEEDMEKLSLITIKWPQHVLFLEPPFPCHWDDEDKRWSTKDIHDVKHNEDRGTVTFRTGTFGMFGMAGVRFSNLPYQAWDVRPERDGSITVQLTAAVLYLEFHIKNSLICITLLKNSPNRTLKRLMGTYYKFYKLKKIMKEAGVDIFPSHDTYCYVENTCEKHWPMERHLYYNMAELCNTFNFSWSRWNMTAGRRHIVLQMREYAPDKTKQKHFSTLYVSPLRAIYVDCTETSQFFSEEEVEQMRFCSDLSSVIRATCSITLRKKIEAVSWEVVNTLASLLVSTRVLSFS